MGRRRPKKPNGPTQSNLNVVLGSFELQEMIGSGGMAEVWRGVHLEERVPAAVKVMTAAMSQQPAVVHALRSEVRAVAALEHPNIVMVLDQGNVSPEAQERSAGLFVEGNPYLVMELASAGTLEQVQSIRRYQDLRAVILVLLDALAHAHGRGVIHRDLTPRNILVADKDDLRPGLKIADFGIAFAAEREIQQIDEDSLIGTIDYMAPEQMRARWRDYGPWTDLYTLGVVIYRLASGRLPWPRLPNAELIRLRLTEEPEPIDPQLELPDGFLLWLDRMLRKDPLERFQHAADAAFALVQLDPKVRSNRESARIALERNLSNAHTAARRGSFLQSIRDRGSDPQSSMAHLVLDTADTTIDTSLATLISAPAELEGLDGLQDLPRAPPMPVTELSHEDTQDLDDLDGLQDMTAPDPLIPPASPAAPPIPVSWKRPEIEQAPIQLLGAGLSLYQVRSTPFVDRDEERDQIWRGLHTVRSTGRPRMFILRGPTGCGKTRLAQWVTERAHELGVANILKAVHSAMSGPTDGLGPMVARHLRSVDLSREETLARVEEILRAENLENPYEWRALTELIQPAGFSGGTGLVRFTKPAERHEVLRRLISRLGRTRQVILWLEDVQWGSDALELCEYLLARDVPATVLILATVQEEAIAERLIEAAQIEALANRDATETIDLGPLSADDHGRLIGQLLPLEYQLADQIKARTNGNPLFAVQLVGDWVQRGVLETSDRGFRIKPGEDGLLPDDVHEVWTTRIERLLTAEPNNAKIALEIASVLGQDVELEEWLFACRFADLGLSEDQLEGLLSSLFTNCLAHPIEGGFAFTHGMVRESLERSAKEAGRWGQQHKSAARSLQRLHEEPVAIAERLGRHLVLSGELEEAVDALLIAARAHFESGELSQVLSVLDERSAALTAIPVPESDERWGEGWLLRATVLIQKGQQDKAFTLAEHAEKLGHEYGWSATIPEAVHVQGLVLGARHELREAIEINERAAKLFRYANNRHGIARALREAGYGAQQRGDLKRAKKYLSEAQTIFEEEGDRMNLAFTYGRFGLVARQEDNWEWSRECFETAHEIFGELGNQFGVALSLNGIGDAARFLDNLEEAAHCYHESQSVYESIGAISAATTPRLNGVLNAITLGRYDEAYRLIQIAIGPIERANQLAWLGIAHLLMLPHLANVSKWSHWDKHLSLAEELLRESDFIDADIAWPAQLTGDQAWKEGLLDRAARAYTLSLWQWQALDNEEKAQQVEAGLARIRSSAGGHSEAET